MIGITGASGSGKTSFSARLQAALLAQNISCITINGDHYYHHTPGLTKEQRSKINFCHPDAIDFPLFEENLLDLASGKSINRPHYNITSCARENFYEKIYPTQVILIEGILIFNSEIIRDLCSVKIFIDEKLDLTLTRRLLRDKKERHLEYDDILKTYETLIRPAFFSYTKPFKHHVNLLLKSENDKTGALKCLPKLIIHSLEKQKENSNTSLRCKL